MSNATSSIAPPPRSVRFSARNSTCAACPPRSSMGPLKFFTVSCAPARSAPRQVKTASERPTSAWERAVPSGRRRRNVRWANERMRLAVLLGECAAPYMGHHGRDHGLNRRHMKGFHLWRECLCDLCSTNLRTLSRRSPEMSQEHGQPRRASRSWSLPPNERSTTRIADTLRALRLASAFPAVQGIFAVPCEGVPCSVASVPLVSRDGRVAAIYGYTYTRSRGMAAVAKRVFRETPLLPISFSGTRWNYDTTQVRSGEVTNDSLLAIRIKDRGERLLWETPGAARVFAQSPYTGRAGFSTLTGGFAIESALEPVS